MHRNGFAYRYMIEQIHFNLTPTICLSRFHIDETGRVYVFCNTSCNQECNNSNCDESCLNREVIDRYYLTAEAIDGGGRRTSISFVVHLTDTNDNKPVFIYETYQVGLDENSKTFSMPVQVVLNYIERISSLKCAYARV